MTARKSYRTLLHGKREDPDNEGSLGAALSGDGQHERERAAVSAAA